MSEYRITPPIKTMQDAFSVKGKNVVITGGSRGIGRGIVQAFAESGANVVILDLRDELGKQICEDLAVYGGRYACIKCDLGDQDSIKEATDNTFAFFDHVDVLVNNAGIATTTPKTSFLEKGMDEWRKIVDVDLIGVAGIIYEFSPHMIKANRGGEIINITSIGAVSVSGCKGHHNAAYNAAKAGGDILTRYLAIVLGDYGIRVNAIRPGPHHSDLEVHLSDYMRNLIDNEMPCHRFGEPIELGAFCVYLSSPAAVHITGCNMNFDGGMLCVK
ncbi:3-oxoacyl-[acyl-carrier-protein] reductase FabG [bioreactor metagenome]|uniref:3-oxoacyl-[acyl-carrier-protein] reductase FabG n=1 Tax=bioreactor metagenome TaxID=1076179 RepID=A0A644WG84_9ZZZZ